MDHELILEFCQKVSKIAIHEQTTLVIGILLLFQFKHLVVDFFIQNKIPYMWRNKHKLFHPGGWLHAGSHGVASILIFGAYSGFSGPDFELGVIISLFEVVAHFIIDWCKMNITRHFNLRPENSPAFWDYLGLDQYFHQVTYLVMVGIWLAK